MAQLTINYTATADLSSFSTWLTNNVASSTYDSNTRQGTLTLNNGVTQIGAYAFKNCTALTSIEIPEGILSLADGDGQWSGVFSGCSNLLTVTFPTTLTALGTVAFSNCTKLNNVILPSALTSLPARVFSSCSKLSSIIIPKNITYIGDRAFFSCSALRTVICLRTIPASMGTDAFYLIPSDVILYVYPEALQSYQNSSAWSSKFRNIITLLIINYTANSDIMLSPSSWMSSNIIESTYDSTTNSGTLTINGGVTSIGDNAFYDFTDLTSVTIPEGVTSIGDLAFGANINLEYITLPESLTTLGQNMLVNCYNLTSVNIPSLITTIPQGMLNYCGSLTSIELPEGITNIDINAFNNCSLLTNVICNASTPPTLGTGNFTASNDTLYVPKSSVSTYQSNVDWSAAFTNIAAAPLKIKYTSTSDLMGSPTSWLTNNVASSTYDSNTQKGVLTLNDNVTSFENFALQNLTSLLTIEIPNGFTKLGQSVFNNCTSLISAILPESLTKFADQSNDNVFSGCTSLTSVNIPDNITAIGGTFEDCTSLSSIDLNNVTSLGAMTFSQCTSLTSIDLKNVSRLEDGLGMTGAFGVFYGCSNLATITSNNLTYIGSGCFNGCTALNNFIIPETVTNIGDKAFNNCTSLLLVTCYATIPPTLGTDNFTASNDTLYVPETLLSTYQNNSSWNSAFTNITHLLELHYTATQNLKSYRDWLPANADQIRSTWDSTTNEGIIILKAGVTEIGPSAFNNCTSLISIIIPEGITRIYGYSASPNYFPAFISCSNLESIILPNTLTRIEMRLFEYCSKLASIILPKSITSIESGAFPISALKSVTCLATTPPSLNSYNNFTASDDTLYVPTTSKSTYQSTSPWSTAFTNYVGLCEVTSTVTGSGSVSPSSTTLNEGESVTLTITPDTGYVIVSVTDNGTSVPVTQTGMTYTISNIAADHTIVVVFKHLFTITTSAGEGGTITPTTEVLEGESFTVTAIPNAHYKIAHFIVDGLDVGTIDNYTFQNLDADHTIHVDFELITYTISTTTTEGGSISPESSTVEAGSDVTLTITPDEGMLIFNVLDNDTPVPVLNPLGMTYTISNIQENHTVETIFMVAQNYGFDLSEMIDTDFMIQTLDELEERK